MMRIISYMTCVMLGLSIILFALLETGHEILHHIENEFHHHHAGHHHTLADHQVKQHHHDEKNGETELTDYIIFIAGFYSSKFQFSLFDINMSQQHSTRLILCYLSRHTSPLTIPPKY